MKQVKRYTANLEDGPFLFGVESWEVERGDVIVVKDGLEKIVEKFPSRDWQTVILTESGRKYMTFQILYYGKRIP